MHLLSHEGRHFVNAIFCRINRTADAYVTSLLAGSKSDEKVVKLQDGQARSASNHLPLIGHDPTFTWSSKNNVVLIGINEDVFNSLQSRQVTNFIRQLGFAGRSLGNYLRKMIERNAS